MVDDGVYCRGLNHLIVPCEQRSGAAIQNRAGLLWAGLLWAGLLWIAARLTALAMTMVLRV